MMSEIRKAFAETHDGYSSDRVIADPALNKAFLNACSQRGLTASPSEVNRALMNLRKRGQLDVPTTRQTKFDDNDYRFAAEIAVRHLERRDRATLDDILVEPKLAAEFDAICEQFASGYDSLRYRWAALGLRKARLLAPEIIGHAIPAASVAYYHCKDIDVDSLPTLQGVYLFVSKKATLYVGEAANLRSRLKKHLDHSDNKQLAQWFWQEGLEQALLELHVLPDNVTTKARRALENELIRSRKPLFNILGKPD